MNHALFISSACIYLCAPLLFLVLIGIQLKMLGRSRVAWGLLAIAVLWGVFFGVNLYHITWVPNVFKANAQEGYLLVRAVGVLGYTGVAIASLVRKSATLRQASHVLMLVLLSDLAWSHLAGRYVGP